MSNRADFVPSSDGRARPATIMAQDVVASLPAPAGGEVVAALAEADVAGVAALFQRVFAATDAPAPPEMEAYIARRFLREGGPDDDIPSLVARRGARIVGFIGVIPMRFALGERRLRGALASTFMVDPKEASPLAGARLMRAAVAGPQDLTVGETAGEVTEAMWRRCGGSVFAAYSLDWTRVLNPGAYALETLSGKLGRLRPLLALARPMARRLDARLRRRADGRLRWSSLAPSPDAGAETTPRGRLHDEAIALDALAALMPGFAARCPLHPEWAPEEIAAIVREGARKASTGDGVHRVVRDRRGDPVGAFVMHGRPGRTARVLQIAAVPGQEEAVVDAAMGRAAALGFSAVTGRAQPWQLDALSARRCVFHKRAATVVHARDDAILAAFRRGEAFFNGYAGETWLRLIGDAFGD